MKTYIEPTTGEIFSFADDIALTKAKTYPGTPDTIILYKGVIPDSTFDYKDGAWVQDLGKAKAETLSQWKKATNLAISNIEVTHNDVVYQGDRTSQEEMQRAITVLVGDAVVKWRAKDNKSYEINKSDLKKIMTESKKQQQTLLFTDYPG